MTLAVQIVVGNFPYGNPASLGEPLGLWMGDANVTGDATGGFLAINFVPQNPTDTPTLADQRRQYIYFCDGLQLVSAADPGNVEGRVNTHWARSNSALLDRFEDDVVRDMLAVRGIFVPDGSLISRQAHRMPIFWDTEELVSGTNGLCSVFAENNLNANLYRARCYGRYYDRQLLSNRSFGRLVSPPPVAPLD